MTWNVKIVDKFKIYMQTVQPKLLIKGRSRVLGDETSCLMKTYIFL